MQKSNVKSICCKARHICLMIIFGFLGQYVMAQQINGVVTDEQGVTLPGVNIVEKGTTNGVVTDFDGNYSISVRDNNAILVYRYLGFETLERKVNGQATINVVMREGTENLDEVVVIGYGTQKRSDLNSAISSVKAADIQDIKAVSFDQMLQGKAAGVVISNNSGQPGSNVSVKIRGVSSLTGTNEPLYVIDGVPISGDARNSSTSGRNAEGNSNFSNAGNISLSPLAVINPNDIESIDILKDASATAIYGSRGSNGVIIITTKSGRRGTGKLSIGHSTSFSSLPKMLNVMDLRQYAAHQNALAAVQGVPPRVEFANPSALGKGTDWQNEIFRTGIMTSNQLSFSGGMDGINYYISGGILNQDGIVIESGFKRYNLRANINATINKFIKMGVYLNGTHTDEDLTLNGQFNGVVATSLLSTPDVPVRDLTGAFAGPPSGGNTSFVNPVAVTLLGSNNLVRKNYSGNFYTEISLFDGLSYRFELGGYSADNLSKRFDPMYDLGNAVKDYANLYYNPSISNSWNLKNQLTYQKQLGRHNFTILAVQESNRAHWEGHSLTAYDFKDNSDQELSGSDLSQAVLSGVYSGTQTLASYLGRVVYDFDDRYGITASIRTDGSSKFFVGNKWGVFKSVAGSWKLSNERFMEGAKEYIDNIKFRFGYGETGNNQIGNNLYDSNLHLVNSPLGTSFLPSNTPNKDLKWETQVQTNVGLDFTLFDSKLSATIDWYEKVSEDFLYQVPLPLFLSGGGDYEGGINPPYFNLGSMRNTGLEFTIGYNNQFSDSFSWNSSLNFSKYNNTVTDMAGLNIVKTMGTLAFNTVPVSRTQEGLPVGSFVGYEALGIYRTDDDLLTFGHNDSGTQVPLIDGTNALFPNFTRGDVIYKDQNNDGIIDDEDLVAIGNPNPDFTFGFTNNFKYKNVDLSVFVQGSVGNDLMNLTRYSGTLNSFLGTNYFVEAADFYSDANTGANLPRPTDYSNINNAVSTRFIEDGSYVRIQNVTLGFSVPADVLSKLRLSRLRVYASGQNLYTITGYSGYDPEVGSYNQDALITGVDNGRYPTPRIVSIGCNIEF